MRKCANFGNALSEHSAEKSILESIQLLTIFFYRSINFSRQEIENFVGHVYEFIVNLITLFDKVGFWNVFM